MILHASLTVRVKFWVASGLTPFVAVIVNLYVPPEPAGGVPENVAVPSPLSVHVSHDGSAGGTGNVQVGTQSNDGKGPDLADGKGGVVGAGDRTRVRQIDREEEELGVRTGHRSWR